MKIEKTMEAKLMGYFINFELVDFIGFAKILNVDNEIIKKVFCSAAMGEADQEEFICSLIEKFSEKSRKERREILKLAKEVNKENAQNSRNTDDESSPSD